ncbi:MAG: survival motor neuron interacting protein 1-domain-containing protein [Benniella sp.]|nr:MAG: survival motor neuron interacting protein 1-domain-containing protein [Benniella sp.]
MDDILPSSGEEYLRMVRAQARSCPAVVVAPEAQEHLSVKNTSLKYRTDWNSCRPAPEGCAPTAEWKDQFMSEFKEAKAGLKRHQQTQKSAAKKRKTHGWMSEEATGATVASTAEAEGELQSSPVSSTDGTNGTTSPSTHRVHNVVVPGMFDEKGWRKLLYGPASLTNHKTTATTTNQVAVKTSFTTPTGSMKSAGLMAHVESAELTVSKESPDVSASVPITVATHLHEAYEKSQDSISTQGHGMIPQPQFMAMLNQGHLIWLLKYHLRWLAEDDITDHEGRWLYALLLKLDPLVESDEISLLRNLAKKCSRIRSHLNSESGSKLATVNMVITIVARLFGQNDLE